MGKNVIFFVTSLQSGGIENYLLRFIEETHLRFDNIIIFCKSGIGGQLETQYLRFKNLQIVKHKVGNFSIRDLKFIDNFFKNNSFSAVCDFTGNFSGLILYLAKRNNIEKRIVFYRNSSDRFNKSFLKSLYNNWIKGLTYRSSTRILANSNAGFSYYFPEISKNNSKFSVIYNGVNSKKINSVKMNLRAEFNIPSNAFVVGHTGRFNPAKNHKTILEVANKLVNKYPDIYFIFCGNGVKKNLNKFIIEKGIENRVLLFENREDIPAFLNTMNCYYFPSLTEGQPNALLEAMVKGLPIIASNIEPIKESVPQYFHKELLNPLDIDGAVEKISNFYLQRENYDDLKEWAIAKFNAKNQFEQFYLEL
ncbi:glycosyltransferase [Sphingobacterium sp. WM]|uniref:glycosyltransferase n=1 Tax=Sphingobacterium sp. WM TaxID=3031802 RepID=UPI00240DC397|nr:glycosyltransferase [Sphingobacterium sp. WM]WFB63283.1 glycosyltransferase [Sphingobacterium sp. WM]